MVWSDLFVFVLNSCVQRWIRIKNKTNLISSGFCRNVFIWVYRTRGRRCLVRRVTMKRIISINKCVRERGSVCVWSKSTRRPHIVSQCILVFILLLLLLWFFFRFKNEQEQHTYHAGCMTHEEEWMRFGNYSLYSLNIKMCSNVQRWRKKKYIRTHTTMEFYEIFMVEMVKCFCCFFFFFFFTFSFLILIYALSFWVIFLGNALVQAIKGWNGYAGEREKSTMQEEINTMLIVI